MASSRRTGRDSSERGGSGGAPSISQLTADLEAEKSMKDLIEKQKNRLKQKVDELETRLKTESDARDEMESEARKAKLDLRRMERELKAAVEDRDMLVRCRLHLSIIDHFCIVFVVLIKRWVSRRRRSRKREMKSGASSAKSTSWSSTSPRLTLAPPPNAPAPMVLPRHHDFFN